MRYLALLPALLLTVAACGHAPEEDPGVQDPIIALGHYLVFAEVQKDTCFGSPPGHIFTAVWHFNYLDGKYLWSPHPSDVTQDAIEGKRVSEDIVVFSKSENGIYRYGEETCFGQSTVTIGVSPTDIGAMGVWEYKIDSCFTCAAEIHFEAGYKADSNTSAP